MPKLHTTRETATALRMTPQTLRGKVRAGLIRCVKLNARVFRFTDEAIQAFIRKNER